MSSLTGGSLPGAPARPRIRPRFTSAVYPACYANALSNGSQATIGSNFISEAPFTGVKLLLVNFGTTAISLAGLCAAVSATAATMETALNADGSPATWVPVTVGGAVPTVPAGSAARPSLLWTDPILVESTPRTDGGTGYLLYTRGSGPSSGTTYYNGVGALNTIPWVKTFNAGTPGRPIASYFVTGDFASSNQTGLTQANANENYAPFIVGGAAFFVEGRVISFVSAGDSLTQGYQAGASFTGLGRVAVSQLNGLPGIACSYIDAGFAGQTTAQIAARTKDLIDSGMPIDVLTLPIDSPNDYTASPSIPRVQQEATMLQVADYALTKGVPYVVMMTPIPFITDMQNTGYAQQRVISGAKLRANLQPGLLLLDAQQIICGYIPTAARTAVVPSNLFGADGAHLNATGQTMLGTALANMLAPLLLSA